MLISPPGFPFHWSARLALTFKTPSYTRPMEWHFCGAILNLKTIEKHFKRKTKPTLCPCQESTQLCSKDTGAWLLLSPIFWGVHLNERTAGLKVLTQPFQSQPLKGNKVEINRVCLAPVPTAAAERELLITRTGAALGRQSAKTSLSGQATALIRDFSHRGQAAWLTHTHLFQA